MSWVAVGVGAATLIGSLVSSNQQKKAAQGAANKPQLVYNAYGELNTPATGAINSRDTIFNNMNSDEFQKRVAANTDAYSTEIAKSAYGKDMQDISTYGSDVLNGKYLQSPVVANYARGANNQIMAANADQLARSHAMFSRNGMGFSTTMQQAQQADKAASAAKGASLESQILANNYQNERALQSAAPSIITGAQNQRLSYLSGLNNALYAPLQTQAGITTQLLGNNQIKDPTYVQTPTSADSFNNGLSSAVGMYSMYKGLNSGNTSKTAGSSAGQLSYWNGTDANGNDIWKK
jgi:hypothetical protein